MYLYTVPLAPPRASDLQLVEANNTHLRFSWSPVSLCCPSIQYHIVASNQCGECPTTTTANTVTCSGNYTQLTSDHPCSFAVRTVVCDDLIGDVSIAVTVPIEGILMHSYNAPVNCMPHYPPPRSNHGEPGGVDRVGWP